VPEALVIYGAELRDYGLVDRLDRVDEDVVVCRVYRIMTVPVDPGMEAFLVAPMEGGPIVKCWTASLTPVSRILPCGRSTTRVRLRETDVVEINASTEICLFLTESRLSRRFPGNRASLRLNGLELGRTYEITGWPVDGKAVTLRGVTGVYYGGLFEWVDAADTL